MPEKEQVVILKDAFNKLKTCTHSQRYECRGQKVKKHISEGAARKANSMPGISIERI